MTGESNYAIAIAIAITIATISEWLKNLAWEFQPKRSKNTNFNFTRDISRALSKL